MIPVHKCNKVRFETQALARGRIGEIQSIESKRPDYHRIPRRSYKCEQCGGWHLTSISRKAWSRRASPAARLKRENELKIESLAEFYTLRNKW